MSDRRTYKFDTLQLDRWGVPDSPASRIVEKHIREFQRVYWQSIEGFLFLQLPREVMAKDVEAKKAWLIGAGYAIGEIPGDPTGNRVFRHGKPVCDFRTEHDYDEETKLLSMKMVVDHNPGLFGSEARG